MVYGAVGRFARDAGVYLIPKAARAFQRYDVKIHRNLYGPSGGRGVRHGRDLGSITAGLVRQSMGDDLDASVQPSNEFTPRKFPKARGGRYNRGSRNRSKYNRFNCRCGQSRKFSK